MDKIFTPISSTYSLVYLYPCSMAMLMMKKVVTALLSMLERINMLLQFNKQ